MYHIPSTVFESTYLPTSFPPTAFAVLQLYLAFHECSSQVVEGLSRKGNQVKIKVNMKEFRCQYHEIFPTISVKYVYLILFIKTFKVTQKDEGVSGAIVQLQAEAFMTLTETDTERYNSLYH